MYSVFSAEYLAKKNPGVGAPKQSIREGEDRFFHIFFLMISSPCLVDPQLLLRTSSRKDVEKSVLEFFSWIASFRNTLVTPAPRIQGKNMNKNLDNI